jgi:hypothetical protein
MDEQQRVYRNGTKVDALYRAIRDSQAIDLIPKLIKQVITDEMWREHYYEKTSETFRFDSFRKFIETHPPDGLGTTIDNLFRMCAEDAEAIEMIDTTLQKDVVSSSDASSKQKPPAISSARQAGLRKLRMMAEANPEVATLRKSVLAGEVSLNSALVTLGIRKRRISMTKDISKVPQALKKNFTPEEYQQLLDMLNQDRDQNR